MVDAPRWTKQVVSALEEAGGLSDILLTHKDDVADADHYAKYFGARVSIHKADLGAARYATQIFEGRDPLQVYRDLLAIPVPGHTKGSVVYLWKEPMPVHWRQLVLELRRERSRRLPRFLLVLVG
jgi:glyoxylase-like metal-dependent hydrolase (beta-lactamase superfamily II)